MFLGFIVNGLTLPASAADTTHGSFWENAGLRIDQNKQAEDMIYLSMVSVIDNLIVNAFFMCYFANRKNRERLYKQGDDQCHPG